MAFKSKAQMKAAFGGYLGAEMKAKAREFAQATPDIRALPEHVRKTKKRGPAIPDVSKIKRS